VIFYLKKLRVTKNILLFRTDRIGDLLLTCPSIKTIKEHFPDSKLSIVTSEKNFSYAKTFAFFDKVFLFPKKSIFKKIKLFKELSKNRFDNIFIFDGKDRSILITCFLKSQKKVAKIVNKKQAFFCKLFKIKFSYDVFGKI
jgi:ADP-heptose:LPS heptosyltransferase